MYNEIMYYKLNESYVNFKKRNRFVVQQRMIIMLFLLCLVSIIYAQKKDFVFAVMPFTVNRNGLDKIDDYVQYKLEYYSANIIQEYFSTYQKYSIKFVNRADINNIISNHNQERNQYNRNNIYDLETLSVFGKGLGAGYLIAGDWNIFKEGKYSLRLTCLNPTLITTEVSFSKEFVWHSSYGDAKLDTEIRDIVNLFCRKILETVVSKAYTDNTQGEPDKAVPTVNMLDIKIIIKAPLNAKNILIDHNKELDDGWINDAKAKYNGNQEWEFLYKVKYFKNIPFIFNVRYTQNGRTFWITDPRLITVNGISLNKNHLRKDKNFSVEFN
jgi:hypothetical protein